MARKDLLKGLMSGDPPAREDAAPLPRYARGAIGAVSRSIAEAMFSSFCGRSTSQHGGSEASR